MISLINYKNDIIILLLVASTLVAIISSCSSPASVAKFDVTSVTVSPPQVPVGKTFMVTAEITNIGNATGIYNAVLAIDGFKKESKAVSIAAGASDTVKFLLSINKSGTYNIAVGNNSQTVQIIPKGSEQKTELKYDDGFANDYLTVDKPNTGYLVDFIPPSGMFTISEVKICGLIYGGHGFIIRDMYLQIWDKESKVIYQDKIEKEQFPLLAYLPSDIENQGRWASMHIPDVEVTGKFYIHVHTGTTTGQGFRMGADDSVPNMHSNVTVRNSNNELDSISDKWNYPISRWFGDKSRVNWMIRVSGTSWITEE